MKTLVDVIRQRAADKPEREAFVFIDRFGDRIALTRQRVWDDSRKFAAVLKRHGVRKGDVVCNTLANSPERLLTSYGIIVAGAISMNGQILLADGQGLIHSLKLSQCTCVIVDSGKANDALVFLERISYRDEVTGKIHYRGLPHLKTVIQLNAYGDERLGGSMSPWMEELENEKEMFAEEDLDEDDEAVIFCTSGSTGFSKLVPYHHKNLIKTANVIFRKLSKSISPWFVEEGETIFTDRALGWFGGFLHAYHAVGAKTVMINKARGPAEDKTALIMNALESERCDQANLATSEVEGIFDRLAGSALPHLLKMVWVGGGPVSALIARILGKITQAIVMVYTVTEFGLVSAIVLRQESGAGGAEVGAGANAFKTYCAGKLVEAVDLKILNANLQPVADGERGEIYVRTPYAANRYLNEPEKTKETFLEDGWIRTGDLGYMDQEGHLFVLGRMKNAIMKGSFIFYPGWLEALISDCPGIKDVVVIGVPDPKTHEEICLCATRTLEAQTSLTHRDVKTFCQNLFLSKEKEEIVPMPAHILFFEEFPMNLNLKVDRAALKAEACKILNIKQ